MDVSTAGTKYQLITGAVGKIHSELYLFQLGYCLAWLHQPLLTLIETLPPVQLKTLLVQSSGRDKFKQMTINLDGRDEQAEESYLPPKSSTVEILMALSVELAFGTVNWRHLIRRPRLAAIGINEVSVTDALLRRCGSGETFACQFCAEQNFVDSTRCNYCGSDFIHWPEGASHPGKREFQPFDAEYLREILLHLAVRDQLLAQSQDERLAIALVNNKITKVEVISATEAAIAGTLLTEPRTPWQRQLQAVGIIDKTAWFGCFDALASLAHHLTGSARFEEAELVLAYAITISDSHRHHDVVDPSQVMLIAKCYGELAALYQATGQIDRARQCYEREQQVMVSDLTEGQKQRIASTIERLRQLRRRLDIGELDVREIGINLDKQRRKDFPKPLQAMRADHTSRLRETEEAMRLSFGAIATRRAGEPDKAELMARRALCCLTEDNVHYAPIRLTALVELALAKHAKGELKEAQEILLDQAESATRGYPKNASFMAMLRVLAKAYEQVSLWERSAFWYEQWLLAVGDIHSTQATPVSTSAAHLPDTGGFSEAPNSEEPLPVTLSRYAAVLRHCKNEEQAVEIDRLGHWVEPGTAAGTD